MLKLVFANSMRRLIRLQIGIIVVVLLALSIFQEAPPVGSRPITPRVAETTVEDPVILTVVNQDGGMVCNEDKYIRLRVYLSGRIEGDSFDQTETCQRKKKTALLDEIRLANVRRALADRDLLRCKNEYPQFAVRVDDYTNSVMTFRIGQHEKSIKLTNPESDNPRNIANYPKPLTALLRVVDEITEHFEFR